MKFFILDDDRSIITTLKLIIQQQKLGTVSGYASNGQEALEELRHVQADIVIVDFLMPIMDGITFIEKAKEEYPDMVFIMLSFVTNKEMTARAYEAGIEFYIHKPVNSIEVCNVIRNVLRLLRLETTFSRMQQLMDTSDMVKGEEPAAREGRLNIKVAETILGRIGIAGEPVSYEILQMVEYILNHDAEKTNLTVADLCARFSDSPKALEQRIRRALVNGMVNLANMGIEDYSNDIFIDLSGTLYEFKEVRQEMEFIRRKSGKHGKASIKKFLYALVSMCNINK